MTTVSRQPQMRRRKARILDATVELYKGGPIPNGGIRKIAARAEVDTNTILYYWKERPTAVCLEKLAETWMDYRADEAVADSEGYEQPDWPEGI